MVQRNHEQDLIAFWSRRRQFLQPLIRGCEVALYMECTSKLKQGRTVLRVQTNRCLEQLDSFRQILAQKSTNVILKRTARRRRARRVVVLRRGGSGNNLSQELPRQGHRKRDHILQLPATSHFCGCGAI